MSLLLLFKEPGGEPPIIPPAGQAGWLPPWSHYEKRLHPKPDDPLQAARQARLQDDEELALIYA